MRASMKWIMRVPMKTAARNPVSARFIWAGDIPPSRNEFVRFEREFDLAEVPASFVIHLFADTRYRLLVNGKFVAAGPGRFVTKHPEYDSHELGSMLIKGSNTIVVEVNFFGASSFQTMPDGQPGFIAWGGGGSAGLDTPGHWKAERMNAWCADAPLFSFAQGPVEICDTRLAGAGEPVETRVLGGARHPWGEPAPFSGSPLTFPVQRPDKIELAGRVVRGEQLYGIMAHDPQFIPDRETGRPKNWAAFSTWILSPRDQRVAISCFWSELFCNGVEVKPDTHTPFGNHAHCILELGEGWNLLCGKFEVLTEYWAYGIGIPYSAELSLHGRRDVACLMPLAVASCAPYDQVVLPGLDDRELPPGWKLEDGQPANFTPARVMAWDEAAGNALRDVAADRLSEMSPIVAESATWCFSFKGEFLGHVVLDVDAPEGTVMDVACDDWINSSGGLALYRWNCYTDCADRFILRGGPQRVQLFHSRGGKFLQVTLRSPRGTAPLSVLDVFVRSRQTLDLSPARFDCGDEVLDWAWDAASRTLSSSTADTYCDCPWREQGNYIGDAYVNMHQNFLFSADLRVARRSLKIFGQAALPDGQLACCAPSWLRKPHEDFTLIWLLALRDYWAHTGDTDLPAELWPAVKGIWNSPSWETHSSGLWNATGKRLFIDWGVALAEREGEANAVLNILRFGAAKTCADLALALGKRAEAEAFSSEARRVGNAVREILWCQDSGRLRASLGSGDPGLHSNVLALFFGLGDVSMRGRILEYLEPLLRDNLARGLRHGQHGGHLELYFLHYALPALAEHGRPDLAELLIDRHYGFVRGAGLDTLPECFCDLERERGSRCHGWSGAAAIYAARFVLGIRPAEAGNPRRLIFSPVVHGISRASGKLAHPDGWIEVSWERAADGNIRSNIVAPAGVEVSVPAPA